MKPLKIVIQVITILIIVAVCGYFFREERIVFNFSDSYYVLDYLTISKFFYISIIIIMISFFIYKYLLVRIFCKRNR